MGKKGKANQELESSRAVSSVTPVTTYMQLIKWTRDEDINKEDLALACQFFLLIHEDNLKKIHS